LFNDTGDKSSAGKTQFPNGADEMDAKGGE
jgi:hypothetical protein